MLRLIVMLILIFSASAMNAQNVLKLTPGSSITLTGGAVLTLDNMSLDNDGTISLMAGDGTFRFSGNLTTTISGTSMPLFDQIQIAKTGTAQLTLQRNISAISGIQFISGIIDLNNNNILLQSSALITGETETARISGTTGGFVEITTNLNMPSSVNPANLGAIISSSQNLGSTIIRRGHVAQTIGSNTSIHRYYDIIPVNNTALNATLRFNYFDVELNSLNENSIVMWRSPDNIAWTELGANSRNTALNYVEKTGISELARQTLAAPSGALPVIFGLVNARCQSGHIELTWKTLQESNSDRFYIERSSNGRDWIVIGSVAASGNSISEKTYYFIDTNPGTSSIYRIVEVDLDGSMHYTTVIRTNCNSTQGVSLYPNPAKDIAWLNLQVTSPGKTNIKVYDQKGALLLQQKISLIPGANHIPIAIGSLPAGQYNVLVDRDNGGLKTFKLIKL